MIFEEKKITLKNGIEAILKTPEIEDAENMLNLIRTASGETEYLARYYEDWAETSIESEEKWIRNNRESANDLVITCFIHGEVAGCCEISFSASSKSFHRAGIGISVLEKYWSLGIGTAFFNEIVNTAIEHKTTEILELEYVEGNKRAKALYEKFGFHEIAVKPNAYKLKDGRYQNLIYMQKYL